MDTLCSSHCCEGCNTRVVCRCLQVTEAEIVSAITGQGLSTLRELRRHTGAGDGCTCCHEELKEYLARHALPMVCEAA
jgi:bacterioferritin-associated ferredoxin